MDLTQVLDTMFKLCVAMAVGYGLNKARVFTDDTNQSLSGLIINVTSPALTVYSVCKQTEINGEVLKLLLVGMAFYAVMPLLAYALAPLLRPDRANRSVYQLLLIFANVSFMGFPVIQSIYGEQAIFYMNIFNIPFTLLIFTYGVRLLQGKREPGYPSGAWNQLFSPGFLSAVLSIAVYFLRVPVPAVIVNALGFVGNVTMPVSMMVIGSMIAGYSFRSLLRERKLYFLSGMKLLLFPALGYLAARVIFKDPMLAGVVTISLGMPSGSLCAMVARQYGTEEQANTAAMGVFMTTLLSVVTVPLLILAIAS